MFLILKFADFFFQNQVMQQQKNQEYHQSVNQFGSGSRLFAKVINRCH